jgi:ferredoxin
MALNDRTQPAAAPAHRGRIAAAATTAARPVTGSGAAPAGRIGPDGGAVPGRSQQPRGPALRVDPIGCRAHGLCAELLPGHVTLDEWGYPILPTGPVPPELLAAARTAVRECPVLALRLTAD